MRVLGAHDGEVYFARARAQIVVWGSLGTLTLFAFAAWLTSLVLGQTHMPTAAGHVIAPLFIGGLVLTGLYTARLTLRGASCSVKADDTGIFVHNPKNDFRIAWSDIVKFDVATDTAGALAAAAVNPMLLTICVNPWQVGRVTLRDGSCHFIEATRRSGAVWRRKTREEEVAQCLARLEARRPEAPRPAPG
jgi:hypothetical protein